MTRSPRAGVLVAVAVLLASLLLAGTAAPAARADPLGQCTTTHGAIVAVDFGHWSGPVVRGCGADPSSGAALLTAAGFSITRVGRFPAFVCRLAHPQFDGDTAYPRPADDTCANTPPASAYWAYWTAKPGDSSWSYSSTSADGDHPVGGEVELWQFGSGARPAISPDALRSHTVGAPSSSRPSSHRPTHAPTSSSRASARSTTRTSAGTATSPAATASTTAGRTSASASARSSSTRSSSAPSTPASTGATGPPSGAATPSVVDATAAAASRPKDSGGSAAPVLIALLVVLVLGGGAGLVALRNRRA